MKDFLEFVSFLKEYEKFFIEFKAEEAKKLQSLTTWNLEEIEKCNTLQQAYKKKMESIEEKRQEYQRQLGLDGYTFSEVVKAAPEQYQQQLQSIFLTTQSAINEIKYLNQKSMDVVYANVKTIGKKLPEEEKNPVAREYNSANRTTSANQSRIEIKI